MKSPYSRDGSSVNSVASIGSVVGEPLSSSTELNSVSVIPDRYTISAQPPPVSEQNRGSPLGAPVPSTAIISLPDGCAKSKFCGDGIGVATGPTRAEFGELVGEALGLSAAAIAAKFGDGVRVGRGDGTGDGVCVGAVIVARATAVAWKSGVGVSVGGMAVSTAEIMDWMSGVGVIVGGGSGVGVGGIVGDGDGGVGVNAAVGRGVGVAVGAEASRAS